MLATADRLAKENAKVRGREALPESGEWMLETYVDALELVADGAGGALSLAEIVIYDTPGCTDAGAAGQGLR